MPQKEQNASFQINIPGITFLDREESAHITLPVPEEYEELKEVISWREGSVRISGITRLKPQTAEITDEQEERNVIERTAVYIDVTAAHEDKNLALRGLICEGKLKGTKWEHGRYDFNKNGNISGFRVFYEEGDKKITLKFSGAAFYWDQPFVMGLSITE